MTSGTSKPHIYPDYCHGLSPTIKKWCPLRAVDIYALESHGMFNNGRPLFHHGNHPIKWVRLTGVIVAIDEFYGKMVYTIDDSSGLCIGCTCPALSTSLSTNTNTTTSANPQLSNINKVDDPKQNPEFSSIRKEEEGPSVVNPTVPWQEMEVGIVVKVKGAVTTFRDKNQVEIVKVEVLRSTDQEVRCWNEVVGFRDVLRRGWVVGEEEEERCRRRAMREVGRGGRAGEGKGGVSKRGVEQKDYGHGRDGERRARKGDEGNHKRGTGQRDSGHERDREVKKRRGDDGKYDEKNKSRKQDSADGLAPANKVNYPNFAVRKRVAGKYDTLGI